jgi:4-alpha-glucanotransferase
MIITFHIHFATQWGSKIRLLLQNPEEHDSDAITTHEMQCDHLFFWRKKIEIKQEISLLRYQYELTDASGKTIRESGDLREIILPAKQENINLHDSWRSTFGESPFATTVFSDCYFKRTAFVSAGHEKGNFRLQLFSLQMEPDRHYAIVGNQDALGNWDVSKKVRLDESNFPIWSINLDTSEINFPIEYKYLIVDTASDEVLVWGGGPNRKIESLPDEGFQVVTDENFIRTIPSWRGAGVAIPVFSLRSKKSFGIGEFYDLKLMVDWAKQTGQKMIQTLPINDTILYHSNYDSYPYNAVSVYALHPIYLHLDAIGKIKDPVRKAYFAQQKKALNAKSFSDYQNVMNVKWEYCKEVYPESSKKLFNTAEYKNFFQQNKSWLVPYAVFSYLRDKNRTPEFSQWPEYSSYNAAEIESLASPEQDFHAEIALYYFLQFHLNKQLIEVHEYACSQGITIKGDIPIGVSPRSVDAWMEPEMFNTNMQAGAPPDDFSATGQNWGFPTYNWELMEKDNYRWWISRFQKLAEYFDAYRIDHILGFFRIWEIPQQDVWGLTGSFNPSLPFTIEDLQKKGLYWDENRFLKPYLKEHVLHATFGKYTADVLREYFDQDGWQNYRFKPAFDTQMKVESYFASLGYNFGNKEVMIRDGLYMLHCEVLFIRDARQPDKFHPRISMHSSATFRDLPDETRRLLDGIYVDYYYHRHNEFWKEQAMKKLPALVASTKMLVCGEDLGMVPDSVPDVMNVLEILSLEIQRMPKKPHHEFAMPQDAPYRSVCTSSTHDMNPIRAWWLEDKNITQRFYNKALGIQGVAPEKCEPWIAERIINQHLESNSMLVILPWQDWLAIDGKIAHENPEAERINVPSNPRNFWCYRMHISLEDLLKLNSLNERIRKMIEDSGRGI